MPRSPSFLLFLLLLHLAAAGVLVSSANHVIAPSSSALEPSSIAWDPADQHFVIGSRVPPAVSFLSDAAVLQTLLPSPSSPATALAVDASRRRLLVSFSSPPFLSAFDLRSPLPLPLLFSSSLPSPPSAIALNPTSGAAFVAAGNQIIKLDLAGNSSILSASPIYGADPLDGLAHVNKGFLLVVQGKTGRMFKVDEEDGAARMTMEVAPKKEAMAVAAKGDGTAIVGYGREMSLVKSNDGWATAVAAETTEVEGNVVGVAVREGRKAYALVVMEEKKYRVEEVEMGKDGEGDMVVGMVLLGLGMIYFLYWRFQMGKLAASMNKKRA